MASNVELFISRDRIDFKKRAALNKNNINIFQLTLLYNEKNYNLGLDLTLIRGEKYV